jgi:hypothetical protein
VANELSNIVTRVNNAIRSDRIKRIALSTVLAVHKPRIFQKGEAESGEKIGTYGTRPISISKKNQARNTGKTYFRGGYAEYKSAVGKNPGFVILRNTDQMYGDYGLVENGGQFGFGFHNETNSDKMGWMTDKYDKEIAALSQREIDLLSDVLTRELNNAI